MYGRDMAAGNAREQDIIANSILPTYARLDKLAQRW